ncbi:MAG: hypothetical protein AAGH83_05920 [Pseudomonadota bacterium]
MERRRLRRPRSVRGLEDLGRTRLSRNFYLRDFLFSEIGAIHGIANVPDDPRTAIAAGKRLCVELLDPLVETFGPIHVRSAFRNAELNAFGNAHGLNCARYETDRAGHIWDLADAHGKLGACACIVIPWFADRYDRGRDWRDLAWWVHDHLPYSELRFFPKLCAFNLTWSEAPKREIRSWIGGNAVLLRPGEDPVEPTEARARRYADFPRFRGIVFPT